MPVRFIPTSAFERAKALLRPDARTVLRYALEQIEDDPDHRRQRRERPDGAVVDVRAEGLLVAYRRVDDTTVHLLDAYRPQGSALVIAIYSRRFRSIDRAVVTA